MTALTTVILAATMAIWIGVLLHGLGELRQHRRNKR